MCRRGTLRFLDESVEPSQVELLRIDAQDVAGGPQPDRLRAERLSQARDVVLERGGRRLRRPFTPQHVDQPVAGDRLVRVEEEIREERARQSPLQRDRPAVLDHRERPEDSELHVSFVALSRAPQHLTGRLEAG